MTWDSTSTSKAQDVYDVTEDNMQAGYILLDPSSPYVWTNQAGGYACKHPEEHGILMMIVEDTDKRPMQEVMDEYFVEGEWSGWCCNGIKKEDIEPLNKILKDVCAHMAVDESKMSKSMEAWLYITIAGMPAVLVWGNSD